MKKLICTCLAALLLCLPVGALAADTVPVLLYHHVADDYAEEDSIVTITPQRFEEHLQALLAAGYTPVSFSEYYKGQLPEKPIIITFDDGYESNYLYAYPLLQKYGVKAAIFAVVSTVGENPNGKPHFTWEQAREMEQSGLVQIESHTLSHAGLTACDPVQLQRELRYSKYLLDTNLNKNCTVLAYPYGYYTDEISAAAAQAGYTIQCRVGNKGANPAAYDGGVLTRITTFGSWTGEELLWRISENTAL